MLTVESMKNSGRNHHVKLMEFTRIFAKKPECLICFFEGEDDKYYGFRIKEILGIEWKGIDCGGKQRVISLFRMLANHSHEPYRKAKTAFFVDRDFDDPQPPEIRSDIYETPCYSIENFYATSECFKQIIETCFKIKEFEDEENENESVFKKCLSLFAETQERFHDAVSPLNAWMFLVRKKDACKQTRTHFDKIKLESLVSIDISDIRLKQPVSDYLEHLYPYHGISDAEIDEKVETFSKNDRGKVFRGKQEIDFLLKFLTKIKDDLCNDSPKHFDRKRKISFSVPNSRDILSGLSQYATTPECLRMYLRKRHALYFTKNG
ncbi:MAG: hypothetical protein BWK80_47135 [Desulfobacteraceae bacterium IS3]|nr:MAG: hypothetical protein BWK80_47135 [Desulfobacteraceae bacterium IS3]